MLKLQTIIRVLFPEGNSLGKVLLNKGAIYFNRQMFSRAAEIFESIIKYGQEYKEYFEAMLLMGQCHFGEEKWPAAILAFDKVWKGTNDPTQRASAYKLLLQSEFLNAKGLFSAGDFANAATAFKSIEQKYPGSDYGDIVLFNAAEACEKQEQWIKACDSYYDLIKKYSGSKLAPDALFNAAGDYEKADKFNKAADAYDLIVTRYPESEKAKDALFNLAFCYEKLGKQEKMAETHERYSLLYPNEKDVEAMLLHSASYYAKAGMYEKAVTVYKSFIRRYPKSPKVVEAFFMIAKCNYDNKDIENALLGFTQAEQKNIVLAQDGLETNNFYAAEAALYLANLKREKFLAIKLELPEDKLKSSLKTKSDLLADAVKAYQRVIQYQSERMFEAAFRVGQLYEDLSISWNEQQRPRLDPIKEAVLEKDILTLSSQLLQKSFIPYKKALQISSGFDSLKSGQMQWIQMSRKNLSCNFLKAGNQLLDAVSQMQNAPVPREIRNKPLHYYQYLKQLYETLGPMKEQVIQYFSTVYDQIDSMQLNDSTALECKDQFVYCNYLLGRDYDSLSVQILMNTQNLPKELSADEREELLFQLEDVIYELQDKAIFVYEDALVRIKSKGLQNNKWFRKILQNLARLSPDKYGTAFFYAENIVSDIDWLVRADSLDNWNTLTPPGEGWKRAVQTGKLNSAGLPGTPSFLWGDKKAQKVYLWKSVFLNGEPRDASIFICSKGNYRLFINGALVMSDSLKSDNPGSIDSATGISSLLKGGDNVIAAEVEAVDTLQREAAVVVTTLIDTTKRFESSIVLPFAAVASQKLEKSKPGQKTEIINDKREENSGKTGKTKQKTSDKKNKLPDYAYKYKNKGEFLKAIEDYQNREKELNTDIKKERLEIQKLHLKKDELDASLMRVKEQIAAEKERIESMSREK